MMVLAPSTVQEAVDLTYAAFDYADRDMNPVLILADGVIGTMMEPVELPEMKSDEEIAAIKESKKDLDSARSVGYNENAGMERRCCKDVCQLGKRCHGRRVSDRGC